MKRLSLITILGLTAVFAYAQIPDPGDPVCAYCDVDLKSQQAHKRGCPYYEAPKEEETSSSSSTSSHLRDYTPLPEMSSTERALIYEVGINGMKPCSHCKSIKHQPWCEMNVYQNLAKKWRAEAESASNEVERKKALLGYKNMVDKLKLFINPNYTKADLDAYNARTEREHTERKAQSTHQNNGTYTHTVSPGTYIAQHYDKELTFGSIFARALGATMPNGEERWLLANAKGEEVGQFSKVEFVEASGINQFILVRDFNGKWGICGRGGTIFCEPKFESVKMLSTIVNDVGGKIVVFDVTMRNNGGVLQHGIYNPDNVEMNLGFNENLNSMPIPCEYDYVELIDRSATTDGVLAKVRKNGLSGVIGTFNGKVAIPVAYSYINTYFTLKGGMYLLVGDATRMGAYHVDDEVVEVVPVTDGYTLDKVKSLIAEKEKE